MARKPFHASQDAPGTRPPIYGPGEPLGYLRRMNPQPRLTVRGQGANSKFTSFVSRRNARSGWARIGNEPCPYPGLNRGP